MSYDSMSCYRLNIDEAEALIAFVKMFERDDIPDDVWELIMNLQEWFEVY